jgi:hypothetical protein
MQVVVVSRERVAVVVVGRVVVELAVLAIDAFIAAAVAAFGCGVIIE